MNTILEQCRAAARTLAQSHALNDACVTVTATALKPEEAIGAPQRRDFPILAGREVMIEAHCDGARGQAFTDLPLRFAGTLGDALSLELTDNGARAVFVAALNALYARLGLVSGTVHCKNNAPEECAAEMARRAAAESVQRVTLIGCNPAIVEALVATFGARHVRCSDLDAATIGTKKFGLTILDGRSNNAALMHETDVVLATGTAFVNDTAGHLLDAAHAAGTRIVFYGVTCAAICCVMQLERWCFRPEDGSAPAKQPRKRRCTN